MRFQQCKIELNADKSNVIRLYSQVWQQQHPQRLAKMLSQLFQSLFNYAKCSVEYDNNIDSYTCTFSFNITQKFKIYCISKICNLFDDVISNSFLNKEYIYSIHRMDMKDMNRRHWKWSVSVFGSDLFSTETIFAFYNFIKNIFQAAILSKYFLM